MPLTEQHKRAPQEAFSHPSNELSQLLSLAHEYPMLLWTLFDPENNLLVENPDLAFQMAEWWNRLQETIRYAQNPHIPDENKPHVTRHMEQMFELVPSEIWQKLKQTQPDYFRLLATQISLHDLDELSLKIDDDMYSRDSEDGIAKDPSQTEEEKDKVLTLLTQLQSIQVLSPEEATYLSGAYLVFMLGKQLIKSEDFAQLDQKKIQAWQQKLDDITSAHRLPQLSLGQAILPKILDAIQGNQTVERHGIEMDADNDYLLRTLKYAWRTIMPLTEEQIEQICNHDPVMIKLFHYLKETILDQNRKISRPFLTIVAQVKKLI